MTHPRYMPAWDEIRCQRVNHARHHSMPVTVDLGKHLPHCDTPDPYTLWIWDPAVHPVDGGPYCPAHDAVSETIWNYGIWEPRETAVALWAFRHSNGGGFVDFGAQIGWYSTLALRCGVPVLAIECDEHNANMLEENLQAAGGQDVTWGAEDDRPGYVILRERIGHSVPDEEPAALERTCLVKIDIEGAETDAIDLLRPSIEAGSIDRILMEVSPVFRDGYGELVHDLMMQGYYAYVIPTAEQAPDGIDGSVASLKEWELHHRYPSEAAALIVEVNSWHQKDLLFVREGVE